MFAKGKLLGLTLVFSACFVLSSSRQNFLAAAEEKPPVFYADFEDTADAVTGQKADLRNTEPDFAPARFGKGLVCDATNKAIVLYPTSGNIKPEAGTVESWVRLTEDAVIDGKGRGGRNYFYLDNSEYRNGLFGVFWFDNGPNDPAILRIACGMGGPRGLNFDDNRKVRDWKKGELHHFAITWQENAGSDFYIDGQDTYPSRIEDFKIVDFNPQFSVGGVDVVDELTIYDYPRTADQIKADFKAKEPLSAASKGQK